MENVVDKLPDLLEKLFKQELVRQWSRETPMNAEEFRFNIVANLHYNLSDKDIERYNIGIWDVLASIEADLLEHYEFGDKIFRCITESELPVYSITVEKKLNDQKFRLKMIEEIPNVSFYILDKLQDMTSHTAISNIFETIRINNTKGVNKLSISEEYVNSFEEELPIDRFEKYVSDSIMGGETFLELLDELSDIDDIEPNVSSCLNDILSEQTNNCLLYLEDKRGSLGTASSLVFQIEVNIINELQDLKDSSEQSKDILGAGTKFYQLAHLMSDFVEKEALTSVVEYMKERTKNRSVKLILSEFVKNYVKDRWV